MAQNDFLFAAKVKINRAFADSDFFGNVFDRHLAIAVAGKQPFGGVQNRVLCLFPLERHSHTFNRPDP
jgi:hypothetical protein